MSVSSQPKKVGFWTETLTPKELGSVPSVIVAYALELFVGACVADGLPDPKTMVDTTWSSAERAAVVAYLRAAPIVENYFGWSDCRICGCRNGSSERSDGVYLWPDGFAHYLEAHHVKPPTDFIAHVLARASAKR
ncbi:MAG: hypothetical protein ACHREM_04170 [Polyangiales bacterium]